MAMMDMINGMADVSNMMKNKAMADKAHMDMCNKIKEACCSCCDDVNSMEMQDEEGMD